MQSFDNALDFTGKSVFVTGGTSLIGTEIVRQFASARAAVVFTYNENQSKAEQFLSELRAGGMQADIVPLNQNDVASCRLAADMAVQKLKTIDILVNNCGMHGNTPTMDIDEADWDILMNCNLRGTFFVSQSISKYMLAQKTNGAIINISSINSSVPLKNALHYGASKAGINQITRSLATELGPHGIRVNAIAPGLIDSPMLENYCPGWKKRYEERAPLKRAGTPADIAGICLFLASPLAAWVTGQVLTVDGGVTLAPAY